MLQWDGENMRFTNIGAGETMQVTKTDGFAMVNGIPTWNTERVEIDASEAATEYIKHTYRERVEFAGYAELGAGPRLIRK